MAPHEAPRGGRQIGLVLGKPPRRGTLLAELRDLLTHRGIQVRVHLPHDGGEAAPDWLLDMELIIQRGLGPDALDALQSVERAGVVCCNAVTSTAALRDRLAVDRRLAAAGVPVPVSVAATTWAQVREISAGRTAVIKARDGSRGRGRGVLLAVEGRLPEAAPFPGPFLVQDFVPGDGRDRKLYQAGRHLRGLLKQGTADADHGGRAEQFRPDPSYGHLAAATGRALGLDVFGVDLIAAPEGPRVVDVNAFPGFRGVPEAARLVADHVLTLIP